MALIAGTGHPVLAEAISTYLKIPVRKCEIAKATNGEWDVAIYDTVRSMDVFIIQPTVSNPNDDLMELLIIADAVSRASPKRITAVIPCLGYARQDKKDVGRVPISTKLVANMLEAAGINRVLTVDLHDNQIQGFFDVPLDNMYAEPYLARYIKRNIEGDKVVVSFGVGSVLWAKRLSDVTSLPLTICQFGSITPGAVKEELPVRIEDISMVGEVNGKVAILTTDLQDTCGVLVPMVEFLLQKGATRVYAVATHGVLSGPAIDRINSCPVTEVIVTNTLPTADKQAQCNKLKVIDISALLGETIRRIHNGESISVLFSSDWTDFMHD